MNDINHIPNYIIDQPVSLSEAYAYCAKITHSHYENFPVSSILIPKSLRPHVEAIYAFARTADDFADEPGLTQEQRLNYLHTWECYLETCLEKPAGPIFTALAQTISHQNLPVKLLKDLLYAFRYDVSHNRHKTLQDLHTYSTYSANPVGRLILHLFGYRSEDQAKQSDAICTGLQLANFWQDVSVDLQQDRIYLPCDEMHRFNLAENSLFDQTASPEFRLLLQYLVDHTRQLFVDGEPLLATVKGRLRYELRLTWLGGMEILNQIAKQDYNVLTQRPKIGKQHLPKLILTTFLPFVWPNK